MGIPVFPVFGIVDGKCECNEDCGRDAGKHPNRYLVPNGSLNATTDESQIRQWWELWPNSNIGGATGDGVVVIDVDGPQGETTLAMYGEMPATLESRTGRVDEQGNRVGRHLFFIQPNLELRYRSTRGDTRSGLGEGVDTRADGGYVVLPPSTHASGLRYEIVEREPVELPEVLADILSAPAPSAAASDPDAPMDVPRSNATPQSARQFAMLLTAACERIANTKPGGTISRHDRILASVRQVAGYYHMQAELGVDEVFAYIDQAIDRCYTGERERHGGRRTARDAWRDGLQNPYTHMPGQISTTPDGRPYLVAHEGKRGLWVSMNEEHGCGFMWMVPDLVTALLRSEWPGIVLWRPKADGSGETPMNWLDAFGRYGGAFANKVEYSYAQTSSFDETRQLVSISPKFSDPPKPVFHDEIAKWLELLPLDPADAPKLLDWLATAPLVMQPTSALVLTRKGSVGKQMLTLGLAEYFGVRPVPYDVAVSRFNRQLADSPLIWLDEASEHQGKSAEFRRLIANDVHRIETKNGPTGLLLGAPRTIMNANNDDPTGLAQEKLTIDDEEAVAERLLHIPVGPRAGQYLRELGGRPYTEGRLPGSRNWIPLIAQHVAWLHQNRAVQHGARLLVHGDAEKWVRQVGSRHGIQAVVGELVSHEASKFGTAGGINLGGEQPVYLDPEQPGVVWASARGLKRVWERYFSEKGPSVSAIRTALQRLSRVSEPPQKRIGSKRPRLFPVPLDALPEFDRELPVATPQGAQ